MSLPVRGAWIEILVLQVVLILILSLPVRGAWIEIFVGFPHAPVIVVAPRKGSVD